MVLLAGWYLQIINNKATFDMPSGALLACAKVAHGVHTCLNEFCTPLSWSKAFQRQQGCCRSYGRQIHFDRNVVLHVLWLCTHSQVDLRHIELLLDSVRYPTS